MPSISPGAPAPAPDWVPYDYSKMKLGNYYTHDLGYRGKLERPGALSDRYKSGPRVQLQNVRGGGVRFRPTAWETTIKPGDLGSYANNQKLMQRLGASGHHWDETPGRNARRAWRGTSNIPAQPRPALPPKLGTYGTGSTVIMKGPPGMFHKPGGNPEFIPNTGRPGPEKMMYHPTPKGGAPSMALQKKFSGGTHGGNINSRNIIGHFPAGSNQMVTKPGFFTGKMPARPLGGAMAGMLYAPWAGMGPVPVETHDLFGRPMDQGAGFEPEYIPSGETEYYTDPMGEPFPDIRRTIQPTVHEREKYIPNPKAGQARAVFPGPMICLCPMSNSERNEQGIRN